VYIIFGLGNPGNKYEDTRHNVGFNTLDYLAAQYGIKINKLKHKSLIGEGIIQGNKIILVKPQTFMNLSGEAIREVKEWYKAENENIIVIYDDISLDVGKIRVKQKGSAGGHNGIKSIIYQINSEVFPRIKIGVGSPANPNYELADYVLGKFSNEEKKTIYNIIEKVSDAVVVFIQAGIQEAMNRYNGGNDESTG
jgi:PTH1 family peptidyl-tRNA hydrolase